METEKSTAQEESSVPDEEQAPLLSDMFCKMLQESASKKKKEIIILIGRIFCSDFIFLLEI